MSDVEDLLVWYRGRGDHLFAEDDTYEIYCVGKSEWFADLNEENGEEPLTLAHGSLLGCIFACQRHYKGLLPT